MISLESFPLLKKGDNVGIISPSWGGPGVFPDVYNLGIRRLEEDFGVEVVEFPSTRKIGATPEERAADVIEAFSRKDVKAVIATIGGDDQVTYIKHLPVEPFLANPKPFFGFSDNTHLANFLWLAGIPSFYGGSIMTQFAMQARMDPFTVDWLKWALFQGGERELSASPIYNDVNPQWEDESTLTQERDYEENDGWVWDGSLTTEGITWGGCLESVDEMLRHDVQIPSLEAFEEVVLILETSEEIPPSDYVYRVLRALGERGILERVKGVLVGRPKAWFFHLRQNAEEKREYRKEQQEAVTRAVREYNSSTPIVQNLDFGHTDPQIPMPYGGKIRISGEEQRMFVKR